MKFLVAFAALVAVATANPLYTWSLEELTEAVNNPNTSPTLLPYLQYALKELQYAIASGFEVDAIVMPTPAVLDVETHPTTWTLPALSDAIQNPHTDPKILPILREALNNLVSAIFAGQNVNSIIVNLPVEEVVEPEIPEPVKPEPVPEIVIPELVSSPLVQIIINVNGQQQQFTEVPVKPTPVQVVDDIPADVLASLR